VRLLDKKAHRLGVGEHSPVGIGRYLPERVEPEFEIGGHDILQVIDVSIIRQYDGHVNQEDRMAQTDATRRHPRRSPTAEELRIWRVFIETAEELRSVLAGRLQSESGLSAGDYAVMLALAEAEDRCLRSSDLAAHIGWERSRLSHHLGRMERRELIRRQDCATDSRGAEIILTPVGAEAFRRSTPPHLHAIRELFVDALTPDQLTAAGEIANALHAHLAGRG
jgi:DNA-binding MarR family transcriptional regulator